MRHCIKKINKNKRRTHCCDQVAKYKSLIFHLKIISRPFYESGWKHKCRSGLPARIVWISFVLFVKSANTWGLSLVLPPGTMSVVRAVAVFMSVAQRAPCWMRSMVYAAAWTHVDVHGPCCLQKPWKFMIQAATGCYGQGSFFCGVDDGCRITAENERQRHTPPKSLDMKPLKRTLRNYDREAEVCGFWWGRAGKDLSLRGWPLGVWSFSNKYMGSTNWT